jgi:hypothetical protein
MTSVDEQALHAWKHVALDSLKKLFVAFMWELGAVSIAPSRLSLHARAPHVPLFPICVRFSRAHIPIESMIAFFVDLHDGVSEKRRMKSVVIPEAGAPCWTLTWKDDRKPHAIIQMFLSHPDSLATVLDEIDSDESLRVLPIIDCEFAGFDELRASGIIQPPLMTLSEFLSLSVESGRITRRQATDIRYALLDLDQYLMQFGLPKAA